MTKTVIFLNRWNNFFRLMLSSLDGENSRRLDSRDAMSLEQARKAVADRMTEFHVAAEHVDDNSVADLADFFSRMDVDASDELKASRGERRALPGVSRPRPDSGGRE